MTSELSKVDEITWLAISAVGFVFMLGAIWAITEQGLTHPPTVLFSGFCGGALMMVGRFGRKHHKLVVEYSESVERIQQRLDNIDQRAQDLKDE